MNNRNKILLGTTIKVKIIWSYGGTKHLDDDDVNFFVEFKAQNRGIVKKEDLIQGIGPDSHNYYAYIDSCQLGPGNVTLKLFAEINDPDAPNGKKRDVSECDTNITLYE